MGVADSGATECSGPVSQGYDQNGTAVAESQAHSQRLVNVKSRLKQAPRYPSLARELIEYQERQLFEYFVVVSLHKKQAGAAYVPELTQQFPLKVRGGQDPVAFQSSNHHLVGTHEFREVWESEEHLASRILKMDPN
ncbi:hypothetical protein P7K49_025773 [Saguinus oedipus]|uniref:Uncharacterized protein n=1 Tax=Saguinus oedipus TaxID=9490 RepID=A0ABQ9UI46_SAGOE|nr:hypothetical protein P7K49_025773 [Saguinus oedipus]